MNKVTSITFSIMLSSHASCKNAKNIFGLDFIFRTRLLEFSKFLKSGHIWYEILVSFFMSRVSVDRYITPALAAMQLQGSYERSTLTMTPQNSYKTSKIWRKWKKRDEVKNDGIGWTCKPIYSLKQVLGHLEVKENVFVIQYRPPNAPSKWNCGLPDYIIRATLESLFLRVFLRDFMENK